jgi:hypothetical protein
VNGITEDQKDASRRSQWAYASTGRTSPILSQCQSASATVFSTSAARGKNCWSGFLHLAQMRALPVCVMPPITVAARPGPIELNEINRNRYRLNDLLNLRRQAARTPVSSAIFLA